MFFCELNNKQQQFFVSRYDRFAKRIYVAPSLVYVFGLNKLQLAANICTAYCSYCLRKWKYSMYKLFFLLNLYVEAVTQYAVPVLGLYARDFGLY